MAGPAPGSRWLRTDIVLLMALIGAVVWVTGHVLLLIFAGIFLAVGLDGLSALLGRYVPLPRGLTLAIVGVLLLVPLALIGWTIVPQFLDELDDLRERMRGIADRLSQTLENHEWASRLMDDSEGQGQLFDAAAAAIQHAATAGLAMVGIAGGVIVMIAIAIFAAANPALYRHGFLALLPAAYRSNMAQALAEAARALRWWFLGQLISMLILGVSVSVGLLIIGIDLWLSLGVLTALLTFIPFLGPIIAGVPILIIGFAEGVQTGLIVLAFYLVIQNVEGNFLVPVIQHRVVNLAPALLISVQVLMSTLFGLLGLILAAPLTVVGMVLVKKLYLEGGRDVGLS